MSPWARCWLLVLWSYLVSFRINEEGYPLETSTDDKVLQSKHRDQHHKAILS